MTAQTQAILFLLKHFENHGNVHTGREAQRHIEAVETEQVDPVIAGDTWNALSMAPICIRSIVEAWSKRQAIERIEVSAPEAGTDIEWAAPGYTASGQPALEIGFHDISTGFDGDGKLVTFRPDHPGIAPANRTELDNANQAQ